MAFAVQMSLQGLDRTLKKLQGLRRSVQRRILRKGIRSACMVGARRGKSQVPRGESGLLKKSLSYKVAKSKPSVYSATGVIGPRVGLKRWIKGRGTVDPVRYGHLVEGGTKPHVIRSSAQLPFSVAPVQAVKRLAFRKGGRLIVVSQVQHPGSRAQRFM